MLLYFFGTFIWGTLYSFLSKVFYYGIVSAGLLSDGFSSNFKRCLVQNKSMVDRLMSQRRPLQVEVLLSLWARKHLMQHNIKTIFILNLETNHLLIYNFGIIKTNK